MAIRKTSRALLGCIAPLLAVPPPGAALAASEIQNLTGLPVYPYLSRAAMDDVLRTDALGHWCRHFIAETTYPLEIVEAWYRGALTGASETDLTHDSAYRNYSQLSGIKLGIGVDYVTVYKATDRSVTSIELFRCSPIK